MEQIMYKYETKNQQVRLFLDDEPTRFGILNITFSSYGKGNTTRAIFNNQPVELVAIKWNYQTEDEYDIFMYSKL